MTQRISKKKLYNFWVDEQSQRYFLDNLWKKLGIENQPKEWALLNNRELRNMGGRTLLSYHGGIKPALKTLYPGNLRLMTQLEEITWKEEWFRMNREDPERINDQRQFFQKLAIKLNIKEPNEWGKVTSKVVINYGGGWILRRHSSVFQSLVFLFPSISNTKIS